MYIPLNNLYHYIEGLFFEPVCIYLFYPHGSRDILNLVGLHSILQKENVVNPLVICNDQEPLNFEYYRNHTQDNVEHAFRLLKQKISKDTLKDSNLSLAVYPWCNMHDKIILVHSEKNSKDLAQYESQEYIGAYYWAHAIIAKDWYRFAEHDARLKSSGVPEKDFLIYSRDWSGSREYRLKFHELLFAERMLSRSHTSIIKVNDQHILAQHHLFKNSNLKPLTFDFLTQLNDNQYSSCSSATYVAADIVSTKISVVLETVFDDDKIHLTEKTLRPIACGHPFMLAAGPGSLDYVKSYGFKTFSPWVNEDYDLEKNSVVRLHKIIASMKQFACLPANTKAYVYQQIKKIADYNQQWFFSKEFDNLVHGELATNLKSAVGQVNRLV